MNGTADLKQLCDTIFKEMDKFANEHRTVCEGFNFSYSPEDSWKISTNILLLTIKPKGEGNPCIPASPWPRKNDFFTHLWGASFQERLLTIPAEIARHKKVPVTEPYWRDKGLETFVDSNMVLASFIPFRTRPKTENKDWEKEMLEFAQTRYWARLLAVWQPHLIITAGRDPDKWVRQVLENMSWTVSPQPLPVASSPQDTLPDLYRGMFHISRCTHSSGKSIYVLGVPNPKAQGYTVYQRKKNPFPPNQTPIQKFLRAALSAYPLLTDH